MNATPEKEDTAPLLPDDREILDPEEAALRHLLKNKLLEITQCVLDSTADRDGRSCHR
jgi:hypothetical protein